MRLSERTSDRLRTEARKARAAGLDNERAADRVAAAVPGARRPANASTIRGEVIGPPVISGLTIAILCGDYA